jgi:hypothetical protein
MARFRLWGRPPVVRSSARSHKRQVLMHSKQVIINGILIYIAGQGGNYSDWYIGTSKDAAAKLSNLHKVNIHEDRYVVFAAYSPQEAYAVKEFFVDRVKLTGEDLNNQAADQVYVYLKGEDTVP